MIRILAKTRPACTKEANSTFSVFIPLKFILLDRVSVSPRTTRGILIETFLCRIPTAITRLAIRRFPISFPPRRPTRRTCRRRRRRREGGRGGGRGDVPPLACLLNQARRVAGTQRRISSTPLPVSSPPPPPSSSSSTMVTSNPMLLTLTSSPRRPCLCAWRDKVVKCLRYGLATGGLKVQRWVELWIGDFA